MDDYPPAELTDMHFCYGMANGSTYEAARLYQERFPNRRQPHRQMFQRIHSRLHETGTLRRPTPPGQIRHRRTPSFEEEVLERAAENPSTSTRAIAHALAVPHSSVWKVLHENLQHPYHVQKVQALEPADFERRIQFSHWFLQQSAELPQFSSNVMFSDESCFTRDGLFNTHNSHIWDHENPHATVIRGHQQRFSVNVWAGIVDNYLIGPHIFPPRLTGAVYLDFLTNTLPELLEDVPLNVRNGLIFQHDGAPPHFSAQVRAHLDGTYPNGWIGRGGPFPWPPRSPDLTALDFFYGDL